MDNEVSRELLMPQTMVMQQIYDFKLPHICILNCSQQQPKIEELYALMKKARLTHNIEKSQLIEQMKQKLQQFKQDILEQTQICEPSSITCSIVICSPAQYQPYVAQTIQQFRQLTSMNMRTLLIYFCRDKSEYSAYKKRLSNTIDFVYQLNSQPQIIQYNGPNTDIQQKIIYAYECHSELRNHINNFLMRVRKNEANYLHSLAEPNINIFYNEQCDKKYIFRMRRALNAIKKINQHKNITKQDIYKQNNQNTIQFISLLSVFGIDAQTLQQLKQSHKRGNFSQILCAKSIQSDKILKIIKLIMNSTADMTILMYLNIFIEIFSNLSPINEQQDKVVYCWMDKSQVYNLLNDGNGFFRNKCYLACHSKMDMQNASPQQVVLSIRIKDASTVKQIGSKFMIIQPLSLFQRVRIIEEQIQMTLTDNDGDFDEPTLYLPRLADMEYRSIQHVGLQLQCIASVQQFRWVELHLRYFLFQILSMQIPNKDDLLISHQLVCLQYEAKYQQLSLPQKQNVQAILLALCEVFQLQGAWQLATYCCQICLYFVTQFNHKFWNTCKSFKAVGNALDRIGEGGIFQYFIRLTIKLSNCYMQLGQLAKSLQNINSCLLMLHCTEQTLYQNFTNSQENKVRFNTRTQTLFLLLNALCNNHIHLNLFQLAGPVIQLLFSYIQREKFSNKLSQSKILLVFYQTKAFYLERLRIYTNKQKGIYAVQENQSISEQITCYEKMLELNKSMGKSKIVPLRMKIAKNKYLLGQTKQAIKHYKECIKISYYCFNSDITFFFCLLESVQCLKLQRKFPQCCDLCQKARERIFQIVLNQDYQMPTQALHQITSLIYKQYLELLKSMEQFDSYQIISAEYRQANFNINPLMII